MARRRNAGSRAQRRREMERLLARRRREGLSYRELSELSGIPTGTLAAWQSRLAKGVWLAAGGRRKRRRPARGRNKVTFVEATVTSLPAVCGPTRTCEIVLLSGRRLVVEEGCDPAFVAALVEAVERRC